MSQSMNFQSLGHSRSKLQMSQWTKHRQLKNTKMDEMNPLPKCKEMNRRMNPWPMYKMNPWLNCKERKSRTNP